MNVRELAQRDVQRYNANGSDSVIAILNDQKGNVVEVGGRASSHNQSYDSQDGSPVNQPQSNITFSMTELTEKGFSFRDSRNQIDVKGWIVEWVDLGKTIKGTITETKPDESLGLIVCFIQENKIDAITHDVTTSIIGDGAINSNPLILTDLIKNTLVSLNADANSGSRFVNWLIDGVTYLNRLVSFYVTKDVDAIATFIAQWDLTTSVVGDGTILPASGTYDDGDIVEIIAEPIDPLVTELDRIEVNTVSVGNTSPYSLLMDGVKYVIAYFISIYTAIQDVFSTTPVDNEFIDPINSYNVAISNTPISLFNGSNNGATLGDFQAGGSPIYYKSKIYISDVSVSAAFFNCGGGSGGSKGCLLRTNAGTIYLYISDGTSRIIPNFGLAADLLVVGWNIVEFIWSGVFGEDATLNTNAITTIRTVNKSWVGNSAHQIQFMYANGILFRSGFVDYIYYTSNTYDVELELKEGSGIVAVDSKNGGLYTIVGDSIWGNFSDEIDSIHLTMGVTIFEKLGIYYPVVYTKLGAPSLATWPTYTKIGDFPTGSGVVIGLSNLYTWPDVEALKEVLTVEGVYDMSGNAIPLDFDSVKAITPSSQIIKTETANNVSQIIIKA